jgi:hypothetical protein
MFRLFPYKLVHFPVSVADMDPGRRKKEEKNEIESCSF